VNTIEEILSTFNLELRLGPPTLTFIPDSPNPPGYPQFPIEKGVPVPLAKGGSAKYPWADLEVGDSFFVPNASVAFYSQVGKARKLYSPSKFAARKVKGGIRVWRTATIILTLLLPLSSHAHAQSYPNSLLPNSYHLQLQQDLQQQQYQLQQQLYNQQRQIDQLQYPSPQIHAFPPITLPLQQPYYYNR
jgi:hypothetical protein